MLDSQDAKQCQTLPLLPGINGLEEVGGAIKTGKGVT